MRETTTAFVHTSDVEGPVARHVTGDLRVADEGASVGHRYRAAPCVAIISGAAHDQGACTHVKVVPGNVHVSEEGRGWVVVCPARLAVVAAARVNTEMDPVIWVRGIGVLIPTQGAARSPVEPHSKPSLGWLVIQNNRITKGILERAWSEAGEGGAAVGRERYAGDVDRVGVNAS